MIQNYFIYNGSTYYAGTGIYVKPIKKRHAWEDKQEVIFLGHNDDSNLFAVLTDDMKTYWFTEKKFNDIFIGFTGKDNLAYSNWAQEKNVNLNKKLTFFDEMSIDGMFIAWLWYIFIMLVSIIFNGRIGIWIVASIIFFSYRNKKLKGRSYKK